MSHVGNTPTLGGSEPTLRRRIKGLGRGWVHCGLLLPLCSAWLLRLLSGARWDHLPPCGHPAPTPRFWYSLTCVYGVGPQMLIEGYLKSSSLSHATNDFHSSIVESFYVPGTVLSTLHLLFPLISITASKVEDTRLLSHWREQVQKHHAAR